MIVSVLIVLYGIGIIIWSLFTNTEKSQTEIIYLGLDAIDIICSLGIVFTIFEFALKFSETPPKSEKHFKK